MPGGGVLAPEPTGHDAMCGRGSRTGLPIFRRPPWLSFACSLGLRGWRPSERRATVAPVLFPARGHRRRRCMDYRFRRHDCKHIRLTLLNLGCKDDPGTWRQVPGGAGCAFFAGGATPTRSARNARWRPVAGQGNAGASSPACVGVGCKGSQGLACCHVARRRLRASSWPRTSSRRSRRRARRQPCSPQPATTLAPPALALSSPRRRGRRPRAAGPRRGAGQRPPRSPARAPGRRPAGARARRAPLGADGRRWSAPPKATAV